MHEMICVVVSFTVLVLGLSYLFQARTWAGLFKDAVEHPHRYIPFFLFTLVMGLMIVSVHNRWILGWPIVITAIGWIITLKSVLYLIYPQFTRRFADWPEYILCIYIRMSGIAVTAIGARLVYQLLE